MDYCMDMVEAEFNMALSDIEKAFPIVKEALLKESKERRDKNCSSAWVYDEDIEGSESLIDIMDAFCWETDVDSDGDIWSINFRGEKIGDEKSLFDKIAPFVKEGSYIQMNGEDGTIWRWVFENKKCIEKIAKISFE